MTSRRIVVFPVMGRRWAFTAVLPTAGVQGHGHTLQGANVRDLVDAMRNSPRVSDQADLLTNFVSQKMHNTFTAWESAPQGSIRQRINSIGQSMLSKLGPTECFLKAIPRDAELVEIVYPNCMNPRLVRRRVRHLAISGEVFHRRYMYGSIALLPFSVILGVLPLPNVILAWNLFRAYSHWRALEGSRRLYYLVTDSQSGVSQPQSEAETQGKSSSRETDESEEFRHWVSPLPMPTVFTPSEVLGSLLVPAKVPRQAISDITIAEICKEYPLDPLEIMKWRDQRLPIKSFG